MIVETPAAVAISAAISFVSIPPVPKLEPNVVVLTIPHDNQQPADDDVEVMHTF